ncbi:hypothetical protein Q0M94_19545 (plasmid) [Deinococcus radiomollis]|uniref:hypothetical protein n=1 Tax=Deinococcus radiomollis TaxID=468916 RepID=UPI003891F46E
MTDAVTGDGEDRSQGLTFGERAEVRAMDDLVEQQHVVVLGLNIHAAPMFHSGQLREIALHLTRLADELDLS